MECRVTPASCNVCLRTSRRVCGTIKRGGEEERERREKGGESACHAEGERQNAGEKVRGSETSRTCGVGGVEERGEALFT